MISVPMLIHGPFLQYAQAEQIGHGHPFSSQRLRGHIAAHGGLCKRALTHGKLVIDLINEKQDKGADRSGLPT